MKTDSGALETTELREKSPRRSAARFCGSAARHIKGQTKLEVRQALNFYQKKSGLKACAF